MKIQSKKIIASFLFVLISFVCVAQSQPPPPMPPPPPGLPIDGGLSILLVLGVFFGVKSIIKSNKH